MTHDKHIHTDSNNAYILYINTFYDKLQKVKNDTKLLLLDKKTTLRIQELSLGFVKRELHNDITL